MPLMWLNKINEASVTSESEIEKWFLAADLEHLDSVWREI